MKHPQHATVADLLAAFKHDLSAVERGNDLLTSAAARALPKAGLQAWIYCAWRLWDGVPLAAARRDTLVQMCWGPK